MRKPFATVAIATLLYASAPQAQVENTPNLKFNAFGTAGVVYSDEDRADFVSGVFAPDGAGHTRRLSPEVDSRLGLQLSADLTPRLSGILQVVSEQHHDDTYEPVVEWANLKYDITPNLNLRAGRMVLPSFMVSQYRKVGYANPWVRPPGEVYRLVPVANNDAINVSYDLRIKEFTNTIQAQFGRRDIDTPESGEIKARNGLTLANTLEYGFSTLFVGYSTGRLTIEDLNPLFDAFRQFGPRGEAIADRFDVDDTRFELMNVGMRYDPGDWFVMGEWAKSESRTFFGGSQGWYVTGGYRYGSLTPYVTLARVRADGPTSVPGLSTAGLPPPVAAQANSLNGSLNRLLGSVAQQQSISVGTRWDFARNMALKVQYDRLNLDDGSPGTLANIQPGFEPGGTVNLFSITLDFVF